MWSTIHPRFWLLALTAGVVLSACADSASEEVIDGATVITEEELQTLAENGEILPYTPPDPEAERAELARKLTEAEEVVEDYLRDHPRETPLFDYDFSNTSGTRLPDGTIEAELPSGRSVILFGETHTRRSDAAAIRASRDPANQRALLEMVRENLPTDCRSQIPSDRLLDGMRADEVEAVIRAVAQCKSRFRSFAQPFGNDTLDEPQDFRSENFAPTNTGQCARPYDVVVGGGNDQLGFCGWPPADPMARNYRWFDRVSRIKDQARRGSCVAFGVAGALEYTSARRDNVRVDLSEQHLYSIAIHDFEGRHLGDGVNTTGFISWMLDRRRTIAPEQDWGYNPSVCRQSLTDANDAIVGYQDSCVSYENQACSETAHQMLLFQLLGGQSGFLRPGTGILRVAAAGAFTGSTFDRSTFELASSLADDGFGVVLSMTVDDDFMNIETDGILVETNQPNGGGHAVQMIRFVEDPDAAGGGWVVIRNSWGCWGDRGYAYLPLRWARNHVRTIDVVRAASTVDNTAPRVTIRSPGARTEEVYRDNGDGAHEVVLQARVDDDTPGPDCCDVTWYSDVDGYLGTGTTITAVLPGPGHRRIFAVARDGYGAIGESASISYDAYINNPPVVTITRPLDLVQPVSTYVMRAPVGAILPLDGEAIETDVSFYLIPCSDRKWWFGLYEAAPFVVGCSTVFQATAPELRKLTFSAIDAADEPGQDGVWIRFEPWGPTDQPWVSIYNPSTAEVTVDGDTRETYQFKASVVSGLEAEPTVRWYLIDSARQRQAQLGTGAEVLYDPDTTLQWGPVTFGGQLRTGTNLTVGVEVTDANGTAYDSVGFIIYTAPW